MLVTAKLQPTAVKTSTGITALCFPKYLATKITAAGTEIIPIKEAIPTKPKRFLILTVLLFCLVNTFFGFSLLKRDRIFFPEKKNTNAPKTPPDEVIMIVVQND